MAAIQGLELMSAPIRKYLGDFLLVSGWLLIVFAVVIGIYQVVYGDSVDESLPTTIPTIAPLPDSLAQHVMYYGLVTNPAREYLESKWTDSTYQVEQGYCVDKAVYYQSPANDSEGKNFMAVILSVLPAKAKMQSYYQGTFTCPKNMPLIHTHPPITCRQMVAVDLSESLNCQRGGSNAFQCEPSRKDYEALIQTNLPFGVIQCDRRAFVFYWPHHYRENDSGARNFSPAKALGAKNDTSHRMQKLQEP